jgi:signal peptidase II
MTRVLVSASLLLLVDQCSKRLAERNALGRGISWGPIVQIRCVTNRRGIYRREGSRNVLMLVWLIALVSAILLFRLGIWFQGHFAPFGLGLAFGGAAGNLLDILRLRSVVDFIDLRWWPVFNLADVAIVAGLVVAFWSRT